MARAPSFSTIEEERIYKEICRSLRSWLKHSPPKMPTLMVPYELMEDGKLRKHRFSATDMAAPYSNMQDGPFNQGKDGSSLALARTLLFQNVKPGMISPIMSIVEPWIHNQINARVEYPIFRQVAFRDPTKQTHSVLKFLGFEPSQHRSAFSDTITLYKMYR